MKKRAVSLLLCLIMVLALLPSMALAAPRQVTSVSITVSEPTPGSMPISDITCGSTAYQVSDTNIGGYVHGVKWTDESTKKTMNNTGDTFVSGHNYSVSVCLEPAGESYFATSVSATVNGKSAEAALAGDDVVVSYKFVYSYDTVAATVEVPTAGKTPMSFQPSISTSGVSLYAYDWYDDNGEIMSKSFSTFQAGETYRLKVSATSAKLAFTSHTTATINGLAATVEEANGNSILFYCDFTAVVDEHEISAVGITVTAPEIGKSPSFSAALDPSTMTVVNRSMGSNEYCENGVAWYDEDTHTYLKPTDVFQSGHTYQISVGWLKPVSGDKLATNSYDEIKATAAVNGFNASISGSATNFIVTYSFSKLAAKPISSVSVKIDAPKLGATPDFTAEVSGEGIDASDVSVIWSDNAAGKTLSSSDKFEAGIKYTVSLSGLKPIAGYEFVDFPIVKLNGETADTEGNQSKLIIGYTFAALSANTIDTVALTIDVPKVGEKASFSAKVPADANYTVESVNWFCDEDNVSLISGDTYGKKTYILNITLTPKSGYSFADNSVLKGTVNGDTAQARRVDGGNVLVTKNFSLGNQNPFTDVKESDYFYNAVLWAYYAEPQVTNGLGDNIFGPDMTCTRAQVMTFLWRAAGCPQPKDPSNPFSDVPADTWYTNAVLWAVEKGITNGVGDGKFGPDMTCTRAHVITFLYRAAGEPGKTGTGNWYDDAVYWAGSKGLLVGTAEAFTPGADCPRKDIVLYLFRQLAK